MHQPRPHLRGARVELVRPDTSLLPHFTRWENDAALLRLSDSPSQRPRGGRGAREMFETLCASDNPFYGIYTRSGRPIGYIGATIDDRDLRACLYISIGEADARGRGYGTEAMRVLLDHLFREVGLHRAYLFVHETNHRAVRSYEKCGFVVEGCLREHVRDGREYGAELVMGLLAHEFLAEDQDRGDGG